MVLPISHDPPKTNKINEITLKARKTLKF